MTGNYPRRALVIGADSGLGATLGSALWSGGWAVTGTSRREPLSKRDYAMARLDLLNVPQNYPATVIQGHGVMFLVAAITGVVACEGSVEAWRINADAPILLAQQGMRIGMHVVFVSSDAVERAPSVAYARQKAHVESFMFATGQSVVRPARILPQNRLEVAEVMIEAAKARCGGLYRWSGA